MTHAPSVPSDERSSKFSRARAIADAVLYEGYILYPYRAGSGKNQVRWQFGVAGPRGAAQRGIGEDSVMQTECLLRVGPDTVVDVALRFLQVQARLVEEGHGSGFTVVSELRVGQGQYVTWDEAVEHEIVTGRLPVRDLIAAERDVAVIVPGGEKFESIRDDTGHVVGRIVRRRWPLVGVLRLRASSAGSQPGSRDDAGLVRLRARFENGTPCPVGEREAVLRRSFVSVHALLSVRNGGFVSLLDPPQAAAQAAAGCMNLRMWPVLVGAPGDTDLVLSSPIILYDYPEVAPESPGDFYDATEIDELLTLRVMTMTEEEKTAARATDPLAAAVVERADHLPPEVLERLHGAVRYLRAEPPGPAGRSWT